MNITGKMLALKEQQYSTEAWQNSALRPRRYKMGPTVVSASVHSGSRAEVKTELLYKGDSDYRMQTQPHHRARTQGLQTDQVFRGDDYTYTLLLILPKICLPQDSF